MMNHIFNGLSIALLVINLAGLSAGAVRLTGLPFGLAKVFTVLTGCMAFFFFEHFYGIPSLGWLLLPSTVFSVWLLWKQRGKLREFAGAEAAFLFGLGYALLWRYSFPNIDASSEKIADFSLIVAYMQGGTLPATDLWLYPYKLTQYYTFQHYSAALMGRILNISNGAAYNIGHCLVAGLVMAPAYEYVRVFLQGRFARALVLSSLILGGSGLCIFMPFLVKNATLFDSMRFIGGSLAYDDNRLSDAGIALREFTYGPGQVNEERKIEMAMETFSYVVQLGDFHAPLGGYVLLATAVGAFGLLLRDPKQLWALGLLTGTLPLCIAVNTWSFPLQFILVGFALLFLWKYRERPDWRAVLGGILACSLLLYPFFSYFLTLTDGAKVSLDLVGWGEHAPLLAYVLQFWPIHLLLVFASVAVLGQHKQYLWFVVLLAVFLILIETININDLYVGRFERFNTTVKWWPWVAALATLLLAPIGLSRLNPGKSARIGTAVVLLISLLYVIGLGRSWLDTWKYDQRKSFGQLDGSAFLRLKGLDAHNPQNITVWHSMMNYLKTRPQGVILERTKWDERAFTEMGLLPLLTNHPSVCGWASHEQLWRGYQRDIEQRWNRMNEFFLGNLPQPLEFLQSYDVQYIIWPGAEDVDPALFEKISGQIGSHYEFVRLDEANPRLGLWSRRP
jgi:uncharacterized membrane protein